MRSWLVCCIGLLAIPIASQAATIGPPLPPRPGPLPKAWVRWLNDAFGGEVETNPDDLRTNAFTGGVRIGARWIAQGDLSTLTDREGRNGTAPGRSDEFTLVAGRIFARQHSDQGSFTAAAGLGLRHADDLGMGDVQNAWHEQIDFEEIDLPYEPAATAGLAWFSAQWSALRRVDGGPFEDAVFRAGSRFGLSLDLQASLSHRGEMRGEVGANLLWAGYDGVAWIGLRRVMRAGDSLSHTAAVVAESEAGSWLVYGLSVGSLFFQGGIDLDSSVSSGSLGYMYRPPLLHSDRGRDVMTAEFGTTLTSYGLGGQVRWQPRWLEDIPAIGERSNLILDYRFGRVPDLSPQSNSVRYQQLLLGLDLAAIPPRDGFYWTPYGYVGLGWRLEDIQVEAADAAFANAQDDSLALQAGLGLRCTFGDRPRDGRGIQYGLSLSWDHASSFSQRVVASRDGSQTLTLLDESQTFTLRAIIAVGW